MFRPHAFQCLSRVRKKFGAEVAAKPTQVVVSAFDKLRGHTARELDQVDQVRGKALAGYALLPDLHKGLEERRCDALSRVPIIPVGERVAKRGDIRVIRVCEPCDQRGTQTFCATAFGVVLEGNRLSTIDCAATLQSLVKARGPMSRTEAAVQRIGV